MKAAVLVGHTSIHSQTGWHTEPFDVKRLLLLSLLCLVPGSHAIDYVQCEAIQRAAARLKAAVDTDALAAQNAIVLPAMEKLRQDVPQNLSTMSSSTLWGGEWLHTRQKWY